MSLTHSLAHSLTHALYVYISVHPSLAHSLLSLFLTLSHSLSTSLPPPLQSPFSPPPFSQPSFPSSPDDLSDALTNPRTHGPLPADPEMQVSMQFSHLSGKSYDPERLSSRSDQSYDPELITIQRSAAARQQQKPSASPFGKTSNPSFRPGSFQSSEQSFDPESRPKSFDPSEQSFDPESRPTSASQPHAPRFNPGGVFSPTKSPPSNSAGNELSVDSLSDRRAAAALDSMSTLLRQAIQVSVWSRT